MTDLAPDTGRRDILLVAYDQERQDERAYWSTTSTLVLSALGAVLVLQTLANPSSWGVWLAAPAITVGLFGFHVYQSAVGSRRRIYLEALELELSSGQGPLQVPVNVRGQPAFVTIRPMAYNRYSWSLSGNLSNDAPQFLARAFFGVMIAVPIVLVAVVDFTSAYRLYNEHHHAWGSVVVAFSAITFLGLITSFLRLTSDRSKNISWETAAAVNGP